jgi:hypothetical protein
MAYNLPTDAANDTVNQDTHPALHNDANTAVNDLDTRATDLETAVGNIAPPDVTDLTERLGADEAQIASNTQGLVAYKLARDDIKVARMRAYYTGTTQQLTDPGSGTGVKNAVQFNAVHYEYPSGTFPGSGNIAWVCLEEGLYQGTAHVQWAGGTGADVGYKGAEIFVTFGTVAVGLGASATATIASEIKSAKVYDYDGTTPVSISMSVPFSYYFYVGDQIQVKMFQNTAGNGGVPKSQNISKALQYSPEFEIHKVGVYGQSKLNSDGTPSGGAGTGSFTALPAPSSWYPTSPFNTPISSPTVDPNSANIVASMFTRGNFVTTGVHAVIGEKAGSGVLGNAGDFSHPVYVAQNTDPVYTISQSNPFNTDIEGNSIYIPAGAHWAGGSDFSMAIIQPDGWEYDLWGVTSISGGQINCGFGRRGMISSDGLGHAGPPQRGGITSAQFNLGLGMIRIDELIAGTISHALFVAVSGWHGRRAPGILSAGTTGQISDVNAPPMGCHFQLDPSYATNSFLTTSGFPAWKQTVLKALRDYGAYVGDNGGSSFNIHLESETPYYALNQFPTNLQHLDTVMGHTGSWDINSGVDWTKLRVITYP